ncbi:DUF4920 domain-containing protein [Cellulophaga sp. E6(2014)]|uniref:DUF4920 domain-containing protein n=1 Tax=Cellulophaga sp. E6(2014) TaxID=1495334 RepID=UPI00051CD95E|nr:DUF4920 domain-containing protein [Cellulophaga sp. E6(2014)]KGK30070.1 branched-chain amino acid aminotransferase [Cellulophaga sp. E6(2014)]
MKGINILLVIIVCFVSCKGQNKQTTEQPSNENSVLYSSFGAEISEDNALVASEMTLKYQNLVVTDTIATKFKGIVIDVCQAKGCWMNVTLDNGAQAMVKFKDYGFFMPKDIAGKEVIVNGLAFIEQMSVEEQRHYAEDGGESEAAIASIVAPKKTFRFEADGVLIIQ